MTEIIRLRNANALHLPEIANLVREAFTSRRNVVPFERMTQKFYQSIEDDNHAIFLARRGQQFTWDGLAWLDLAAWKDDGIAVVLHFYATGGRDVREALVEALVTTAKAHGADRLFTWDANHKPAAFPRLFRSAGPAKEVMRAYEFDLSQAEY